VKPLLVDPSGRGGIVRYTRLVARSLCLAGANPSVLASRGVSPSPNSPYEMRRWLPRQRWSRPRRAGLGFYALRGWTWLWSAAVVRLTVLVERPDVVHFQAPINRRLDAILLRQIARRTPVVWTAHDVLPPERAAADERRFASIYQAAHVVVVHGETAAAEVRLLAGVEPLVIEHVPDDVVRIDRTDARRRLGLPEHERILGAIGFIRAYKGYDLLADVWERLGGSAPLLLVVGEAVGDDVRSVIERLERTGRAIVRTGYASDDDLQLSLSAVDALLLPYVSASESGLIHLARAIRLPVVVSDAPQLAATVRAAGAGLVLPREIDAWAEAVTGELPPPPSKPPSLETVGRAHLEAYEEALRRARGGTRVGLRR
jgi:glycosyltransferase involved in cell wall biosynthesis